MACFSLPALVLGVALLLAVSPLCSGAEPPTKAAANKNYRELVSQLASKNAEATTRNESEGSVTFPKGYDVLAQQRIAEKRRILHDNIEESLPFLVATLDDKRYCMTINWADGDAYYNFSVGDICRNVIASHLEVYRDEMQFSSPQHWNRYNYPISKEWWEQRQKRSLAQLQIEAIDWAIERRKVDPEKTRGDNSQDLPNLQKLRDTITKSGKPAKSQPMLPMVTSDK